MKYFRFLAMLLVAVTLSFTACSDSGSSSGGGGTTPVTEDAAALDADDITFTGSDTPSNVTGDFTLPTSGSNGTTITWAEKTDAGNNIALSGAGNSVAAVTWPESSGFGPYAVTLTATITKGIETTTKDISITVNPPATTKVSTTADSVTFKMVLVPGGLTFKTQIDDRTTDPASLNSVANAYWIGETEVTYELWQKVYTWATDAARGANRYYFANPGKQGDNGSRGIQHPVNTVNWRDSMVWCNALTEWYNAQKSTSYDCVYTYSSAIIRDSRDTNATACDGAVASTTAKGFRLPSLAEWSAAARYKGSDSSNGAYEYPVSSGKWWTPGNYASGATAAYTDAAATGLVAVYNTSSTAAVKSKTTGYNALGLYDMSGNVWEWNFDWHPSYVGSNRVSRGGSWFDSAIGMQVGGWYGGRPSHEDNVVGFRFARTQ